ncbi:hypothetical protein DSM106972_049260 [Dulcicalothrix desertica PCC 7102]|uniref:DUF6876 domain-containing protein n=1 Tax=Dulcicalothrix desertica PCC 7102 TaxID=232991 RepID=A0A433VD14_9CYAN|nr:hypothetical protein DSM106972_049260 [Dulcicalothrix desertica PCC 7102]TWH43583.1 hypothetical protein CAL7102_07318 [Dulcicalothrix desertica PCC 7102]
MKIYIEVKVVESVEKINAKFKQLIGSDVIYQHWLGMRYTSGIKYLAEAAECFWLLDAIASHQNPYLLSNPQLQEFQIWRLVVQDKSGILICELDTNQEVMRQEIPYTNFPLPHIKLYLVQKVLLLPNEY